MNQLDDVLKQIREDMASAMRRVENRGYEAACNNTSGFYSRGNPLRYKRTGTYGTSPRVKETTVDGNTCSTEIYLDSELGYFTGSFSTATILDAIENGEYGVLGKSGMWEKTENEVMQIADEEFSKL